MKLLFDPNRMVESTIRDKSADNLIPKEYNTLYAEYAKLKGFWSKAAFVYFLSKSKESFKAVGKKMLLDMQLYDTDIYKRYISIFYKDIKKNDFLKDESYFAERIVDAYMNHGVDELITLCNMCTLIGRTTYTDLILTKVSLSQEQMKLLL